MKHIISNRIETLKPSAIREFFKYSADPGVIALSAGGPAPESLPIMEIQKIIQEIFMDDPLSALAYGVSEGIPALRERLKKWLAEGYDSCKPSDDLLIVSGGLQCADLTGKVLLNEGDTVLCETPSFTGVLNVFRSYNANLVGIPMEDDGMNVEQLEKELCERKDVKLIYVIPNCQNPTGITMSLEKRQEVYRLAKAYGAMIYEDNPYGDLRFTGGTISNIKSMDTEDLVLYAGTFSKILSPGIRVGYLVAPKTIFDRFVVAKQVADVHTNIPGQMLALRFMEQYDIREHITKLRKVYEKKCGLMLREMEKQFPTGVCFTRPLGGLFVWVTLPGGMDGGEFCKQMAEERKVAAVPGSAFAVSTGECQNAFRVTYSSPSEEEIMRAVLRIGELLHEWVGTLTIIDRKN
jgi:2-aminoadipate transaminase